MRPPKTLVLELPSPRETCPMACLHCIHKNVKRSTYPILQHDEIVTLLTEGKAMGIEFLNIYPHNDEISFEPMHSLQYIKLGHQLGYKVKTVSNGANPKGIKKLLPYLHRIALSVDAIDIKTYTSMRHSQYHQSLLESIETLKNYKCKSPLKATALIVVNKETLPLLKKEVENIYQLNIFDKIKILEMLPIGSAKTLTHQALNSKSDLNTLTTLRQAYHGKVDIGTPLWRVRQEQQRGCLLGYKDLVIGPNGQLAGCSLLFYLNNLVGNLRGYENLQEVWTKGFDLFRHKENFVVDPVCKSCAFYKHDLCWGGCGARGLIFGANKELERSCGIPSTEESKKLYKAYLTHKIDGSFLMPPNLST
ncbi:radical SAM/SPASM domain-containing protein [bacterium]|nr:radical SAM/SPASM domain-containing protein [bacterium]MBU1959345.1 radical SAM/SPASM domain-containing protein [bacterium]